MNTPTATSVPFKFNTKSIVVLGMGIQLILVALLVAMVVTVPVVYENNVAAGIQTSYWVGLAGLVALAILLGGLWASHFVVKKTNKMLLGYLAIALPSVFIGLIGLVIITTVHIQLGRFNLGYLLLGVLAGLVLASNVGWVGLVGGKLSRLVKNEEV